ncbi:MAG: patatin-like phospholipase family protein [Burkholderiaceae bacterium]|jgi:NTE family protein|nr:patatin-like phospholipase family protein [Burkholderiaceae bacterium]
MPAPSPARRRLLLGGAALVLTACQSTPPAPPVAPPPAPTAPTRPLRIGLALGGGAARGFAHIGVIKTLEAQGFVPDLIAGTSAGSVVGALYAGGFNGFDLQRLALAMDENAIADWSLPSRGVLRGEALQNYINKTLENRPIEKLPRRLAVTATDLQSGELMVFERGNTGMAVRASSSVPAVFQPVSINGRDYVDGGLVSPVPARVVRKMGADVVIAVDISSRPSAQTLGGSVDLLLQTFAIMGQSIASHELTDADVVIRPALGATRGTDFQARHLSILEGEAAASAQLRRIQEVIGAARTRLARAPG